jgi:hypothetical protein
MSLARDLSYLASFRIRERIYWLYTRWDFIFLALSYGLGDKREDIGGVMGWFYWLTKQVCWGEVMAVLRVVGRR